MILQPPTIIKNILSDSEFELLKNHAIELDKTEGTQDSGFGRKTYGNTKILNYIHRILLIKARDFFQNDSIEPTFSMISIYRGDQASLFRHKDDNACTYHFDVCLFQNDPWDIWVNHDDESKPYTLYPNQALAMHGEDQEHWREDFPDKENNVVCNAFFFFCEPDHWFFTKGPEYLEVIRSNNANK